MKEHTPSTEEEKTIVDLTAMAVQMMIDINKKELSTDEFEYDGKMYAVKLTVEEA